MRNYIIVPNYPAALTVAVTVVGLRRRAEPRGVINRRR